MRGREHADKLSVHMQWNRDLGERGRLARNVIRIQAHIGRVMHFAGRIHVAGHALSSDLLAIALLVYGAATNSGKHQLVVGFIMQVDGGFKTAERLRNLTDNFVYQLIQIEN